MGKSVRILFIGNSYTYHNNLPGLLKYFAKISGVGNLKVKMIVRGGANLKLHWNAGKARKEIRRGKYDFAVLQEQSRLAGGIKNGVLQIGNPKTFFEYARRFHTEIKKSGAKTAFFLTWAAESFPKGGQAKLNTAYRTIAKEVHAILIPVGPVWQEVRRKKPRIKLYTEDGAHPTPTGTYLIACIFYKTLFHKSPVGLPALSHEGTSMKIAAHPKITKLNPKVARFLQTVANNYADNLRKRITG